MIKKYIINFQELNMNKAGTNQRKKIFKKFKQKTNFSELQLNKKNLVYLQPSALKLIKFSLNLNYRIFNYCSFIKIVILYYIFNKVFGRISLFKNYFRWKLLKFVSMTKDRKPKNNSFFVK